VSVQQKRLIFGDTGGSNYFPGSVVPVYHFEIAMKGEAFKEVCGG
jgi:hypothetical protein